MRDVEILWGGLILSWGCLFVQHVSFRLGEKLIALQRTRIAQLENANIRALCDELLRRTGARL